MNLLGKVKICFVYDVLGNYDVLVMYKENNISLYFIRFIIDEYI